MSTIDEEERMMMTRREERCDDKIKTFHTHTERLRNCEKMPITPIFSLSQDKSSLTIKIRVPYVRVSVR